MKAGCLHCANSANGMFKHRGVNTEFLAPWETVTQPTALSSAFILKQSVLGSFGFPPTGRNYNLQWLCLPPAPAWWNCVSLSCLFSLPWYVFLCRYSPAITWLSWPPLPSIIIMEIANNYVLIHGKNISHNTLVGSAAVPHMSIDKLFPALLECFGIILCGYIAGRWVCARTAHTWWVCLRLKDLLCAGILDIHDFFSPFPPTGQTSSRRASRRVWGTLCPSLLSQLCSLKTWCCWTLETSSGRFSGACWSLRLVSVHQCWDRYTTWSIIKWHI